MGIINQVNYGFTTNTCQISETEDLVVSIEGEVSSLLKVGQTQIR